MVNERLVLLASLALVTSSPVSADGLHSSLSFPQCTDTELSSNFPQNTEFEYDVLRKGKKIGSHRIQFARSDLGLSVTAKTKMKVKLLFVTVYKYEYVSEEVWCGDSLLGVQSRVNDNGSRSETLLRRDGSTYVVQKGDQTYTVGSDFFPTNHWNKNVIGARRLFNTITGELDTVSYSVAGSKTMDTKLGTKTVTQYSVGGDLPLQSFYDRSGNWSGMAFEHKDGSTIEFRCIKCGLPERQVAGNLTAS